MVIMHNGCIHTRRFDTAFSWMEAWELTQEHALRLLVSFLSHRWPPTVLFLPSYPLGLELLKDRWESLF